MRKARLGVKASYYDGVGETIVDNWRAGMDDLQVATRDGGAPSTKTSVTVLAGVGEVLSLHLFKLLLFHSI
jgi:hypothetical protein